VSEQDVLAHIAAGTGALDERAARRTLAIADQTQGAAVAADGFLWLAQSDGKFGRLQKVDAETGMVMASFAMPAGIEDLEFAADGRLWTVSEAGARRWSAWRTFYPLVFSVDPKVLR
jgi:outer membrane protein assembly factor BamB